jgi:hypothetical protein
MDKMTQACKKNYDHKIVQRQDGEICCLTYGLQNLMWSNFGKKNGARSPAKLLQLKLSIFRSSSESIVKHTFRTCVNCMIQDRERSVSEVTYESWDGSTEVIVG